MVTSRYNCGARKAAQNVAAFLAAALQLRLARARAGLTRPIAAGGRERGSTDNPARQRDGKDTTAARARFPLCSIFVPVATLFAVQASALPKPVQQYYRALPSHTVATRTERLPVKIS